MDQYELLEEKLGEGTFGIVRLAKRKTDGKRFAVKISKTDSDGIAGTTLREVSNLRNVKGHPYIVGLEAVYLTPDSLCMVLEFCSKDLAKFIRSHVDQKIPRILIVKFTRQIIDAVSHCHSINIVHRDIKPQNILVDVETEKVKLADFGLTRQTLMKSPMTPEVITLWYRAPDLLLGRAYDWSIDMWSLGCVLGEMATGRPLFPGDSEIDTLFRIFRLLGTPENGYVLTLPEWKGTFPFFARSDLRSMFIERLNEDGLDLLLKLIDMDRYRRISAKKAHKHPFVFASP